jgi:NO-binding membrane sensor protein with MHYT domain
MGGSGIWAMHFIANRAIVLNDGDPHRQISYSPGFTALSFFLPIIVLLKAFYFLGSTSNAKPLFIILAGILTGTAVCGMHYLGDYGIANYTCHYRIYNVVGAAVIAVIASLVALSVFFRLRATWTDTWWKRMSCAAVLASAVVGMHWTAAVGTRYQFKGVSSGSRDASRVQTVIVCAVLVS